MKNLAYAVIGLFLFLVACKDQATVDQLTAVEKALAEKTALLKSTQQQLSDLASPKSELLHLVFFQLKEGHKEADINELLSLLKSLEKVKSVNRVRVGKRTETNDPRAKTDYQLALLVAFDDTDHLATYQQDTFHLEVRQKAGPYLAGPPVVYDFTVD